MEKRIRGRKKEEEEEEELQEDKRKEKRGRGFRDDALGPLAPRLVKGWVTL